MPQLELSDDEVEALVPFLLAPSRPRARSTAPRGEEDGCIDAETDVVRRAQQGDAEAVAALVARHRTSALRVATVVLGSPGDADDVVQTATERALDAIATLDADRPFRPWFLRIVANTAATTVARGGAATPPSCVSPPDPPTPRIRRSPSSRPAVAAPWWRRSTACRPRTVW